MRIGITSASFGPGKVKLESLNKTDSLVQAFETRGVTLLRRSERGGKTLGLNAALKLAKGDIVLFSDANILYDKMKFWLAPKIQINPLTTQTGKINHLNNLWDHTAQEKIPTRNGFKTPDTLIIPRQLRFTIRCFRRNSPLNVPAEDSYPKASGSNIARNPAITI